MAVILFEAIVETMEILDWGIWNGLRKEGIFSCEG